MARLNRRAEYRRSAKELSRNARLRLRVAELGIADNPLHRDGRIDVQLGGRWVVLESNGTLLIYFHLTPDDTVSLNLVVDLDDLPDWFLKPAGTWFEA